MSVHKRRVKLIEFALGATQYECQVENWKINNNTPAGERRYAQCPAGEFVEEVDPDYSLELKLYADWRSAGISRWLWQNDGENIAFTLDHHPDVPAEHVTWTGTVLVQAPTVDGTGRQTEPSEVTLTIIGLPVLTPEVP